MGVKIYLLVFSLLLLTSATNLQGHTQKKLITLLFAQTSKQSETKQDETAYDDYQDDETEYDQAGDFSLVSNPNEEFAGEKNVTVINSDDPVQRTLTVQNEPEEFKKFTQETESRDMFLFDMDEGDYSYEGHLNFAIVTAYTDDEPKSGAVFAVSDVKEEAKVVVSGLEKPVNTCFHADGQLLYVVDTKAEDQGVIYQYDIDYSAGQERYKCVSQYIDSESNRICGQHKRWHEGDRFELFDKSYTIVYEGSAATDWAVDSYGNLYFSTVDNHIYGISYEDLYQRNLNATQELLNETAVGGCTGIDIRKNGELWWSNSERTDTLGTLSSMKWEGHESLLRGSKLVEVQYSAGPAIGLAVNKNYAYYISDNNTLFEYNIETGKVTQVPQYEGQQPKSVAYGGEQIWIADYGNGSVSRLGDKIDDQTEFQVFLSVPGVHGMHLINSSVERLGSSFLSSFSAYLAAILAICFL